LGKLGVELGGRIFLVRGGGETDFLGLLERITLGHRPRPFWSHEGSWKYCFPELEAEFAMHYVAVAAEHQIENRVFSAASRVWIQSLGIGVAHEGSPAVERVAR